MATKQLVQIKVNGRNREAMVEPSMLLVHFIRSLSGLTGTHVGCDTSHCGACTVVLDGKTVKSCTMFAVQADGCELLTVEGLMQRRGKLHPLQEGFKQEHGLQCGYCTPGMLMSSYALLEKNPTPTEEEIRWGISGNLCRCTGYQNIVKAVQFAAGKTGGRRKDELSQHRLKSVAWATPSSARRICASSRARATMSTMSSCPTCSYGHMVRSPYAHARLKGMNTEKAMQLPGVVGGHHRRRSGQGESCLDADALLRQANGAGYRQSAVSVAGSSLRGRGRSLYRRRCRRTGGSRVRRTAGTGRSAQGARSRRAHSARGSRTKEQPHLSLGSGRPAATDKVFADAEVQARVHAIFQRCHPSPLETCGCVADFNRATGRLTIYLTSQAPHAHRTLFAIVGGIPENNIRVISPDIGGGFGNKVPIYPGYVCAVVASLTIGPPGEMDRDAVRRISSRPASRATTT